jgi:hypothetical protein
MPAVDSDRAHWQERLSSPGSTAPLPYVAADADFEEMPLQCASRTPVREQLRGAAPCDSDMCGDSDVCWDSEPWRGRDKERAAPPVAEEPVADGPDDKRAEDEVQRLVQEIHILEGLVAKSGALQEVVLSDRTEIERLQGMLTGFEIRYAEAQDELVHVRNELLQLKLSGTDSVPRRHLALAEAEVLSRSEKADSAAAARVERKQELTQLRADVVMLTGETGRMAREVASSAAARDEARRSRAATESRCETLIQQLSDMIDRGELHAAQVERFEFQRLLLQVCLQFAEVADSILLYILFCLRLWVYIRSHIMCRKKLREIKQRSG